MNQLIRSRRNGLEDLEPRHLLAVDGFFAPTPSLTLDEANPIETISFNVGDAAGRDRAAIILRVKDADFADEGRLDINGLGQISLFGPAAGPQLDEQVAELAFSTPASWWHVGANKLTFSHIQGKYYEVQTVQVAFLDSSAPVEISRPATSQDALHVYHPNDPKAPPGALRDIKAAVARLAPGDTLIVHEGTYTESFGDADIPGGENWNKPVTIKAEGRVVLRPRAGSDRVFTFSHANTHHVILDGFVMDAINVRYEAVKITTGVGFSHNIWIRNSEIMHAPLSGVLLTGATHDNRFTNVHVHSNGTSGFDHGFYIATSNNIVENSMIDHNSGWGVHVYIQDGKISDNQVINNVVHNNGTSGRGLGIGLYSGPGHRATGNVVFANAQGGISYGYGTSSGYIADNTVYNHPGDAEISGNSVEEGVQTIVTNNTILELRAPAVIPQPLAVLFDAPTLEVADIVSPMGDSGDAPAGPPDQPDVPHNGLNTPAPGVLPINVTKFTPRQSVMLYASKHATDDTAIVTLQVVDADFSDEGTLSINGRGRLSLFGPNAIPNLYDGKNVRVTFSTPASWWNDGENELIFQHERTDGHEITYISVGFLSGPSAVDYSTPIITVGGRTKRG